MTKGGDNVDRASRLVLALVAIILQSIGLYKVVANGAFLIAVWAHALPLALDHVQVQHLTAHVAAGAVLLWLGKGLERGMK